MTHSDATAILLLAVDSPASRIIVSSRVLTLTSIGIRADST